MDGNILALDRESYLGSWLTSDQADDIDQTHIRIKHDTINMSNSVSRTKTCSPCRRVWECTSDDHVSFFVHLNICPYPGVIS